MANLIRIQNQQAPGISDPYGDAQRQQDYADLIAAHALRPHYAGTGTNAQAIQMGITQLAEAFLGGKLQRDAGQAADQADASQRQANEAKLEALIPAVLKGGQVNVGTTLDSVAPSDPTVTMPTHAAVPDELNPAHAKLASALAGVDPRAAGSVLSQALLARATAPPPKPESFDLAPGASRYTVGPDGKPVQVASNPKDTAPTRAERKTRLLGNQMAQDYDFYGDGRPDVNVGAPYKHSEPPASVIALQDAKGNVDEAQVGMLLQGQPVSQAIPGFGQAAAARRSAAQAAAADQIMSENPGMSRVEAGMELARRNTDYVAGRSSVSQLTKMLGATRQASQQLDYNINGATQEMAKLKSTDLSPIFNAIERKQEKWTGDPAYSSLFYYLQGAAMEASRLQSGGQASVAQLHEGAAHRAEEWASIGMTPASWAAVAKAMSGEGSYRIKTFENSISQQQGRGGAMDTPPVGSMGGAPTSAPPAHEMTATGPGGQKLALRNGQWVPL